MKAIKNNCVMCGGRIYDSGILCETCRGVIDNQVANSPEAHVLHRDKRGHKKKVDRETMKAIGKSVRAIKAALAAEKEGK